MAITPETLKRAAELRAAVADITDQRTRQLAEAWVRAFDEVTPALAAGIDDALSLADAGRWPSRSQILRSRRLMHALDLALGHLELLARQAGVAIGEDASAAATAGATAQPALIATQMPPQAGTVAELSVRFDRLDPRALEAIVARTTQQVTALTYPISGEAYQAMLRELVRGVAVGDNPREAARRMVARVEGRFAGGLTRALVISRSEVLDAHRAAATAAQNANADVLQGWTWHCSLDRRACPSCWSKHGTMHPLSEPGPYDHQQGRCSRSPVSKSWRSLGFDIEEPPSVMADAETVFKGLPHADQLAVMGPARLAALDSGRASWSDLSVRRTTPGWRDSFAPRPARDFAA